MFAPKVALVTVSEVMFCVVLKNTFCPFTGEEGKFKVRVAIVPAGFKITPLYPVQSTVAPEDGALYKKFVLDTSPPLVIFPVTVKLAPILVDFATPSPPDTSRAPDADEEESVAFKMLVAPNVDSVDDKLTAPVNVLVPETAKLSPILQLLAIPAPPEITNAPVVIELESSVEVRFTAPEILAVLFIVTTPVNALVPVIFKLPPMYAFLVMPTPPKTCSAPELILVASVVAENKT